MSLSYTAASPSPPTVGTHNVDVISPPLVFRQNAFSESYTDHLPVHTPPTGPSQVDLMTAMLANTAIEDKV